MTNRTPATGSVVRQMTKRYTIALSMVATGMLAAYLILVGQMTRADHDAEAINVSGRQRMLSQRIALLVGELHHQRRDAAVVNAAGDTTPIDDASDSTSTKQRLDNAIRLMRQSQYDLTANDPVDEPLQLEVTQSVRRYLANAKLALHSNNPAAVRRVQQTAADPKLLGDLDTIVARYQRRAEKRVETFGRIELALLIVGLVMLIAEIVFIFRPMTRMTRQTLGDLNVTNDELREFAYRISHDLRAPVVSSLGLVEMTQDMITEQHFDDAAVSLDHVERSLSRVVQTVTDITMLMKSKQELMEPTEVALSQFLCETVEALRGTDGFESIDWKIETGQREAVVIVVDVVRLMLQNLLSNAIKYRDKSRPSWCRITANVDEDQVIVEVSDNGLGIPPEFESRLFKMFERFHPTAAEGTGLGLYLVAQNASLIGGSVRHVPSSIGTIIRIQFPVRRSAVMLSGKTLSSNSS